MTGPEPEADAGDAQGHRESPVAADACPCPKPTLLARLAALDTLFWQALVGPKEGR